MYDVIVAGLGGMGSAAAYHLSRRGKRVLGLEQFTPAHDLGSSHGHSRIIRQAYFEGEEYVPLVQRAYELWEDLERQSGEDLMSLTGALMIGAPDSELVSGSVRSAKRHDLPHEMLDAGEIKARHPALDPPPGTVALYESRAGFVSPEKTIEAHLDLAARGGANLRFKEPVLGWETSENGVRVETPSGVFEAERLVLCSGAWSSGLLGEIPLQPERHVLFWFEPRETPRTPDLFAPQRYPVFIWEPESGRTFYSVPDRPEAIKAAFFWFEGEDCDPDTLRREVSAREVETLQEHLDRYVPALAGRCVDSKVCMYTNSPDSHFVLSEHPDHPQVSIACGFSGHGYKFASVIGEILADLATEGETSHQTGLFSAQRFHRAGA